MWRAALLLSIHCPESSRNTRAHQTSPGLYSEHLCCLEDQVASLLSALPACATSWAPKALGGRACLTATPCSLLALILILPRKQQRGRVTGS